MGSVLLGVVLGLAAAVGALSSRNAAKAPKEAAGSPHYTQPLQAVLVRRAYAWLT